MKWSWNWIINWIRKEFELCYLKEVIGCGWIKRGILKEGVIRFVVGLWLIN